MSLGSPQTGADPWDPEIRLICLTDVCSQVPLRRPWLMFWPREATLSVSSSVKHTRRLPRGYTHTHTPGDYKEGTHTHTHHETTKRVHTHTRRLPRGYTHVHKHLHVHTNTHLCTHTHSPECQHRICSTERNLSMCWRALQMTSLHFKAMFRLRVWNTHTHTGSTGLTIPPNLPHMHALTCTCIPVFSHPCTNTHTHTFATLTIGAHLYGTAVLTLSSPPALTAVPGHRPGGRDPRRLWEPAGCPGNASFHLWLSWGHQGH